MKNLIIPPNLQFNKLLSTLFKSDYYTRFPANNVGVHTEQLDDVLNAAIDKPIIRHREKYREALQAIIFNLYTCSIAREKLGSEERVGVLFSRNRTYYHNKSRYDRTSLAYQPFIRLLNSLEDKAYIRTHKGFKSRDRASGVPSTTELTKDGQQWLEGFINECKPQELNTEKELIYLVNENKKNAEYEDTEKTNQFRQQLKSFNNFIAQHSLSYISADDQEEMQPHSLFLKYHRKFHKDFTHGGRLYSPIQNLKKEERQTIKLNGQPTVELDFKSLHLRLLRFKES